MAGKSTFTGSLLCLCIISQALGFGQKGIFYGTLQFPTALEMLPNVRAYYSGNKIIPEINESTKQISFAIPEARNRNFFYLLVTTGVEFCSTDNTVPYLRLKKGAPYKFYTLELCAIPSKLKKRKRTDSGFEASWTVKEIDLATINNGKIPDETLIVCYHPDYVQSLEGGSMVELPKLVMRPDMIKLAGSELKLHEQSDKWFLAALNTDTIHDTVQSELRIIPQSKTVLAMCV